MTISNVLSSDDATFDTGLGGWSVEPGASIDRVTSPTPHAGSHDLRLYDGSFLLAQLDISDYFDAIEMGVLTKISVWVRQSSSNTHPDNRQGSIGTGIFSGTLVDVIPDDQWVEMGWVGTNVYSGSTLDLVIGAQENAFMSEWGEFFFSDVWVGQIADTPPPTALTSTSVETDNIHLAWTVADPQSTYLITWHDGAPDQESSSDIPFAYEVEVSDDGVTYTLDHTVFNNGYVRTVSGLTPSTEYWFRVRTGVQDPFAFPPTIAGGYSEYSDPLSVTTDDVALGGWGVGQIRMGA